MPAQTTNALAESIYLRIKSEIWDFQLLPGDRFTESEIAQRHQVSRTPVRDALYRLKREGYLEVAFRSGWSVRPFDFARFDDLYDMRIVLESAAVERLCQMETQTLLQPLRDIWMAPAAARETESRRVAQLDEEFHCSLVAAAGNQEMTQVHAELTEKIRVIRRLDFLKEKRIDATYEEHAKILRTILRRKPTEAILLLRSHITHSKNEVRKITLHMLHEARSANPLATPARKPRRSRSSAEH